MELIETKLKGACLVRMKRIEDARGFFARAWCRDTFAKLGLNPNMVQLNTGFSHKQGTLRGLHYQEAPHAEAKFVRCTRGAIFDVAVDLRPASPTRGQWFGAELTADNGQMLYVPEGFAHGYQTLVDGAEMYYMTSAPYAAGSARGVRYNDPAFAIQWPLAVSVISDADQKWPDFVTV
jgi:dTDP-4-dehydrorhamnose 3,5-epimerase